MHYQCNLLPCTFGLKHPLIEASRADGSSCAQAPSSSHCVLLQSPSAGQKAPPLHVTYILQLPHVDIEPEKTLHDSHYYSSSAVFLVHERWLACDVILSKVLIALIPLSRSRGWHVLSQAAPLQKLVLLTKAGLQRHYLLLQGRVGCLCCLCITPASILSILYYGQFTSTLAIGWDWLLPQ